MTGRAGQRRIGPASCERRGNDRAYHGIRETETGPSYIRRASGELCLGLTDERAYSWAILKGATTNSRERCNRCRSAR
jgi:hypothetical protein